MRVLKKGMSGTDVMEIQATLNKMGYYNGQMDGIFGSQMESAVRRFQTNFGLSADGVIGANTYSALNRYLLGSDTYTIKEGDSFYKVAQKYYTNLDLLLAANPGLDPQNLQVGQKITVPYGMDVVDTNISYTYDIMERDIEGLKTRYPFIETGVAGQSVLGRNLYYLRIGTGSNPVFFNAAHHGLEWITTPLLMKFAEQFARAYVLGQNIGGYNAFNIYNNSSIYIMPMVNPDGVDLVLNGLKTDNPYYSRLISWNKGSTNFSKNWQANIRGVDLNHNYDALWQEYKEIADAAGITSPGPTRYPGEQPISEPETQAVERFTKKHNFKLVIAYHTQGEVIYWNFQNRAPAEAKQIGQTMSLISGYALDNATGMASYSGYKDWFIQDFGRPGYTVEAGLGTNPLPISQFDSIYSKNLSLLLYAAQV
ncbi:MAG: peptidoglycan-binding protein [Oscillospiraceae bacterium]|jgi:g-D-glutamyl-meso-diaminopimelate peptidase|nr:peptidoglycan-binding protein [Oscillospiraceae bacterium]